MVIISMFEYLEGILLEAPAELMNAKANLTPAANYLFEINEKPALGIPSRWC